MYRDNYIILCYARVYLLFVKLLLRFGYFTLYFDYFECFLGCHSDTRIRSCCYSRGARLMSTISRCAPNWRRCTAAG